MRSTSAKETQSTSSVKLSQISSWQLAATQLMSKTISLLSKSCLRCLTVRLAVQRWRATWPCARRLNSRTLTCQTTWMSTSMIYKWGRARLRRSHLSFLHQVDQETLAIWNRRARQIRTTSATWMWMARLVRKVSMLSRRLKDVRLSNDLVIKAT